jgi:hypothetical protein
MSPCGFSTNVSNAMPSGAGGTGNRGVLINGFCTTGIPTNPLTGNDILVATVTLSGCPAGSLGFVMDLDSGDDVFGTSVAQMVDKNSDPYYFTDADLTDGAPMCAPTAVTMTGFDANNANPAAGGLMALWPLAVAGAAVVAGGAYAVARRKR